ncbi:MAG TPA: DUF2510 domain-containing protein [Acidimicrobiales bacterium]|nr:DUF2510 domain-containing protein [Acidimicrobiales bacterium]
MISIGLIVTLVAISMIVGAVDLVRQPGWAWRSADESKLAYLVLVVLVPIVGLGMYLVMARPKVVDIAKAGRAASLPFERYGDDAASRLRDDLRLPGTVAAPAGLGSFGGLIDQASPVPSLETVAAGAPVAVGAPGPTGAEGTAIAATFYSSIATRTVRPPAGLTRSYNPKQRTSLPATDSSASVPAGWKADPTGRHQFRYWDGSLWTENVADAGIQARDAVSS